MRFVMKLTAVILLTLGVQIAYEVVRSVATSSDDIYGVDTARVDAAIQSERRLNACNPMTRRVVACVLTIPVPGDQD